MFESDFAKIEQGTVVITVTSRLAQRIIKDYNAYQLNKNTTTFPAAKIYSLDEWLLIKWSSLEVVSKKKLPILLSSSQEFFILQNIAKEYDWLQLNSALKLVLKANQLFYKWCLNDDLIKGQYFLSSEVRTFLEIKKKFEHLTCENNFCTKAKIIDYIVLALKNEELTTDNSYMFVGFDDFYPQLTKLVECLKEQAKEFIFYLPKEKVANNINKICFKTQEGELKTAAIWAKSLLENSKNKDLSCTIVIPGLEQVRDKVENIFFEILEPLKRNLSYRTTSELFNISAGKALSTYPICKAAFIILKSFKWKIKITDLCFLLRTPFIKNSNTEYELRALIEYKLRRDNLKEEYSFKELVDYFTLQDIDTSLVEIFKNIDNLYQRHKKIINNGTITDFYQLFNEIFSIFEYPGQRVLDSIEYQTINRFKDLLKGFLSLELIGRKLNYSMAVTTLGEMADDTIFQAKTKSSPIQVLGLLEAAGQNYTHLWVTGLSNEVWPAIPDANPFLPIEMQRELLMPHSSSARELEFANALMARFTSSANKVIFSCYTSDAQKQLQISSLLADIPETKLDDLIGNGSNSFENDNSVEKDNLVEVFVDEYGPKLGNEKISGGVNIINYQHSCSFKAFAKMRLHAEQLSPIDENTLLLDRGILVHSILESFWRKTKSKSNLIAYSNENLKKLLSIMVRSCIEKYLLKKNKKINKYWEIEEERLNKLIFSWLSIEKQRDDFEVAEIEKRHTIELNNLTLNVRIDRVDKTANGMVVVDYKTGKLSSNILLDEQLRDLQLPLYCVGTKLNSTAVVFAQLRTNDCVFFGLSKDKDLISGVKTSTDLNSKDWDEQLSYWQSTIKRLSEEIMSGDAKVAPIDVNACRYCDLSSFCRIKDDFTSGELKG